MYSNYISTNMEHTPTVRYVPISVTYREIIAKAFALTSLLGILFILVSQWSEYVAVLDLLDKKLMLILNFRGSVYVDNFWYDYSQKVIWMPLAAVALWTSVRDYPRDKRDKLVFFLVTILLVAFLDQLSSGVIKPLVGRLRPSHDPAIAPMLHYVNGYRGGLHGFVSGHATVSVGIITWLGMIYRDKLTRISLILFSGMLCYSRIYLGVHYPGDILCGALIGFLSAYFLFPFLSQKIKIHSTIKRPYVILFVFYLTLVFLLIRA
ncbi:MAG: phosphatase PAP2 family protein [Prevotella sp.]|nr:phosphatase PAP2 family protein [Prevotella sp.]MCH4212986.1 phosphatase PAP2 family protein [Prevotella sp.]MCH4242136.1 phosphatase PAP2 family protein [Prevotella sp.]